jgi:hypothetical protein
MFYTVISLKLSYFSGASNTQPSLCLSSSLPRCKVARMWIWPTSSSSDVKNERNCTLKSPFYLTVCPSSPFILTWAVHLAPFPTRPLHCCAALSPSEALINCAISGFRRKVAANWAPLGFYATSSGGGNYRYSLCIITQKGAVHTSSFLDITYVHCLYRRCSAWWPSCTTR